MLANTFDKATGSAETIQQQAKHITTVGSNKRYRTGDGIYNACLVREQHDTLVIEWVSTRTATQRERLITPLATLCNP